MADTIVKGISIKFAVDDVEFDQSIDSINKSLKTLKNQVKSYNKELKIDPSNADVLKKKLENLSKQEELLKKQLKGYKDELENLSDADIESHSTKWQTLKDKIDQTQKSLEYVTKEEEKIKNMNPAILGLGKSFNDLSKNLKQINKLARESLKAKYMYMFDHDNIFELTPEDFNKFLDEAPDVSQEQTNILLDFITMRPGAKEMIKKMGVIISPTKEAIEYFKNYLEEFDKKGTKDIQELEGKRANLRNLEKLLQKESTTELIIDFDTLEELIPLLKFEDQLQLYEEIYARNTNVYDSYDLPEAEETKTYDDLKESNTSLQDVMELLFKYKITFLRKPIGELDDEEKDYSFAQQAKLAKYIDLAKADELLAYLDSKHLISYINRNPERITKVLLFSSKELIEDLINTFQGYGISIYEMLQQFPQRLYPSIREVDFRIPTHDGSESRTTTSGALNNAIETAKFYESLGLDVARCHEKCSSSFNTNVRNKKKTLEQVKLYIPDIELNITRLQNCLTIFAGRTTVMEELDRAIEAEAYDYASVFVSRVINGTNFDAIKLARSKGLHTTEIFHPNGKLREGDILKAPNFGGLDRNKTYELYNAVTTHTDKEEYYYEILANNDNATISPVSLEDYYVKKLDENNLVNNYTYKFTYMDSNNTEKNVLISRIKVLRCLETLLSQEGITSDPVLIMAVIKYNSMLKEAEIDGIKQTINTYHFQKGGRHV